MIIIIEKDENLFSILRKSLILASLSSGVYFVIKSLTAPAVIGAVIGSTYADPYIVLAVSLFLFSMALTHFYHTE